MRAKGTPGPLLINVQAQLKSFARMRHHPNDIFASYIDSYNPKTIGAATYIYTGICVWIAPAATPWQF